MDTEKSLYVNLYNDWLAIFAPGRYNWVDFTFINLQVEWARSMGSFEFCVALLGFSLRVYYIYDHEAEQRLILAARCADLDAELGKEHAP